MNHENELFGILTSSGHSLSHVRRWRISNFLTPGNRPVRQEIFVLLRRDFNVRMESAFLRGLICGCLALVAFAQGKNLK